MSHTFAASTWLMALIAVSMTAPSRGEAQGSPSFTVQKLTDGVYASLRTEPIGLGVDANNLFVVGPDGVVVVDTNFGPSSTRQVLAELRRITAKPVTHVVFTHWHDDHVLGGQVYRDAYPAVQFVAHAATKEYLPGRGLAARKAQVENLPGFATALRAALDQGKNLGGAALTDEERAGFTSDLRLIDSYLKDAPSFDVPLPSLLVTDTEPVIIKSGSRQIEVRHIGRGHTAGDVVVHLPQDGIVATGDLVVAPIPLVGGDQSHVTEWAATLDRLIAIGPRTIVPGHGPVMHDVSYVRQMRNLFSTITFRAKEAVGRGETLEQARKTLILDDVRKQFAGESRLREFLFRNYVTGPSITSAFTALK
jgi:cyclase